MSAVLLGLGIGILLGSALGLFGGGGGVLAVPLLVGALGMDVDAAATTSLVIVLCGAIAGLAAHQRSGRVIWRAGALFGAASIAGSAAGAALAVTVPDSVKLAAFALLLVVAGLAMIRNARSQPAAAAAPMPNDEPTDFCGMPVPAGTSRANRGCSLPVVVLAASATGLITGFLGVGGGFLVIPALVLTLGMPLAYAAATGLLVVAISSLTALLVRVPHVDTLNRPLAVAMIVLATVTASAVAARFAGRLSPRKLGTGFGALVLGMSVLVASQAAAAMPGP